MNGNRKSDEPIVPEKSPNNGPQGPAEGVEERGSTKGNSTRQNKALTQRRSTLKNATRRIREAAQADKKQKFTALWHHVYDVRRLRQAFKSLERNAAPGSDGVTWSEYASGIEARLEELSSRLKRGAYRPKPLRRVDIPKSDGGKRTLGIAVVEDKVVQTATLEVLNAIYETDFMGFSYGFRPGRGPHNALDAVTVGIERQRVNYVLDADIRGFFDAIDHEWLIRFIEHRIADKRVIRHIKKWLHGGVLIEDAQDKAPRQGSPQGAPISPLLANIYLHYVFDLWAHNWRKCQAKGRVIIVRYADDFIVGFQNRSDAQRFREALIERFAKFNLELHADKTRLIEFGRYAAERRARRGEGKPETFKFLGLRHRCDTDSKGRFQIVRRTDKATVRAKLKAIKAKLMRRRHTPVTQLAAWLASVLRGHYAYFFVPGNERTLLNFRKALAALWRKALSRRSQKATVTWARMRKLTRRFLPKPAKPHPYPQQRLRVITQGRSPVR